MSTVGRGGALEQGQLDYESIRRKLFFEVDKCTRTIMLLDNSGCAPWTTTGIVSNAAIVQLYTDLGTPLVIPAGHPAPIMPMNAVYFYCAAIAGVANTATAARERFLQLRALWLTETSHISRLEVVYMHAAYQEIIGMGKDALPFIFDELNSPTGRWFWALRSITGHRPFDGRRGVSIAQMKEAWMEWGRENGFA